MRRCPALGVGFLFILLCAGPASAAPPDLLRQADDRLVAVGVPSDGITLSDDEAPLVHVAGDRIAVAPVLAAAPHDPVEALALAALLHGYFDARAAPRPGSKWFETLAALGVAAGGMALDLVPDADDEARRSAGLGEQAYPNPSPAAPNGAVRAVAMLTAAGGCTAPMVSMLRRLRGLSSSARQEERAASLFASRAMRDLGSVAYPPDSSCLR